MLIVENFINMYKFNSVCLDRARWENVNIYIYMTREMRFQSAEVI